MDFSKVDMSKVYDVDPMVIERTRQWLLGTRHSDGTWAAEQQVLHEDPTHQHGNLDRLLHTAYIAWRLSASPRACHRNGRCVICDLRRRMIPILMLALVAKAIGAIDHTPSAAADYLDRLDSLKHVSDDGKFVWWELDEGRKTPFYGEGKSANVEATALATLAGESGRHGETSRTALAWLVAQKDPAWYLAFDSGHGVGSQGVARRPGTALGSPEPRQIDIAVDDQMVEQVTIPADAFDVVREIDVTGHVGLGPHRLSITSRGDVPAGYQVLARHYLPRSPAPRSSDRCRSISSMTGRN